MPDPVGVWRGARQEGVDYGDDIMSDNSGGIFEDSDGLVDYDSVKSRKTREGIEVEAHCRFCNKGCQLTIEWPELFVVAQVPATDLLPRNWTKGEENPAPYPDAHCSCGNGPNNGLLPIFIAPDWAEKELASAIRSNLVTPEQMMQTPMVQDFLRHPKVQQMLQQGWRPVP